MDALKVYYIKALRRFYALFILIICSLMMVNFAQANASHYLTLFAAASLKPALDPIIDAWNKEENKQNKVSLRVVYGGSASLARQIEHAAPADIYLSAHPLWVRYLEKKAIIPEDDIHIFAKNRLILASSNAQKKMHKHQKISSISSQNIYNHLSSLQDDQKIAVGFIQSVPVGIYAKQALQSLKLWSKVEPNLVSYDNVNGVIYALTQGEVLYGIIYESDLYHRDHLLLIERFPEASHDEIFYVMGFVPRAEQSDEAKQAAQNFSNYLLSSDGQKILIENGFLGK